MMKHSDNEIARLFSAHHNKIVSYANGIVQDLARAEDVAQEAYVRFQRAQNEGQQRDNPVAYLYRIVRNLAVDHHRRATFENRLFSTEESESNEYLDEQASLERKVSAQNELEQIVAALETLPERTRVAFEMHRFGGYTMQQIGDHFGVSKSMATQLVAQALVVCRRASDPLEINQSQNK